MQSPCGAPGKCPGVLLVSAFNSIRPSLYRGLMPTVFPVLPYHREVPSVRGHKAVPDERGIT